MKYRKKPVVIDAVPWTGDRNVMAFFCSDAEWHDGEMYIRTKEGRMHATLGDWIIKGVQGEFYPCKPDIFNATYELVQD
jgi:hypothetical protein